MGKAYVVAIVGRIAKHENKSLTRATGCSPRSAAGRARSRQRRALAGLADDDHLHIGVSRQDALREAARRFWKR
jgi:uncharacterized protein YjiS (DUF1127 family)